MEVGFLSFEIKVLINSNGQLKTQCKWPMAFLKILMEISMKKLTVIDEAVYVLCLTILLIFTAKSKS